MQEIAGRILGRRFGRAGTLVLGLALVALPWTPAAFAGIETAPPDIAVDDTYETDEDQALEVAAPGVLENDVVLGEASCAAVTDASTLAGDVALAPDGGFTFTPTGDFNGVTSFTYGLLLAGPEGCPAPYDDTATVTITVRSVNDPPSAVADSFQFVWNQTLNIAGPGVLANDSDPDGDSLTAIRATDPAHGVLTLAANGGFSYTPATAACPGTPDAFSYRASDGTATSVVRVVMLRPAALPCPTPFVSPSPSPTPGPTATPEPSPSASAAVSTSPSAEPSPSPDPNASTSASVGPTAVAAPSPVASADPGPVDDEGGAPLSVLLVVVLLAVLLAFGAAFAVQRWLEARRTGGELDDGGL